MQGIHGICHAYRVLELVRLISENENLDVGSKRTLEFCAIFHDIGRTNDGIDDYHGIKTIKKLEKLNFLGLNQFNNVLVKYIIENHCVCENLGINNVVNYQVDDKEKAVYLLKMFKDSDNLDRVRLFDLDINYLRFEFSKSIEGTALKQFKEGCSDKKAKKSIHSRRSK